MTNRLRCEAVARVALGGPLKREGAELLYRCPHPERHSNNDAHPSLKINPKKDVFLCCPCGAKGKGWALAAFLAGCDSSDKNAVRAWLKQRGISEGGRRKERADGRGPVVATFVHEDMEGHPVCRKLRHEPGAGGREKDYTWQILEGGRWKPGLGNPAIVPPLYRLPHVKGERLIFLFESHTDAECAVTMGLAATTSGGTGSWRTEYADMLTGKEVCLIPDNDVSGAEFATKVCASLSAKARLLKVVSIAPYPDFRRWAKAGGTRDRILALYEAAPALLAPSGAELIQRFEEIFKRYIVALQGVPLVGALYAFMTHCFEIFSWIPYLSFSSPLESCGKSHAADIVGWASARPEILVSISEAALFRLITQQKPTVVVDEAEVLSGDGETAIALRAVLHAGCAPDDGIIRCAPKTHEVERFSPWCPKIFCAIGKLPRVLASRCIVVGMKRKCIGERIKAFIRARVKVEVTKLGTEIAAWMSAHEKEIRAVYESFPDESFGDRSLENFAPLGAILNVADPHRLEEFRQARLNLTRAGAKDLAEDSICVRLLSDIHAIFVGRGLDRISSGDLVEALVGIETSSWSEWSRGKPISKAKLAHLLSTFGITPSDIRFPDGKVLKGYRKEDFVDAWSRYLAFGESPTFDSPFSKRNNATTRINTSENADFGSATEAPCSVSENTQIAGVSAACCGVAMSEHETASVPSNEGDLFTSEGGEDEGRYQDLARAALSKVSDQRIGLIPWLRENHGTLYEELVLRLPDEIHRLWEEKAPLADFQRILDLWLVAHRTGCEMYQSALAQRGNAK